MKVGFRELDYKKLGARWRLVISALFLLLLPLWIIIIWHNDYRALYNQEIWINNLDNAIIIIGESIAFYVTLMMAKRMEGTRSGPGIGLLALGLFFLALNDILWWAASWYQYQYLAKYGSNALLIPEAMMYWILVMSEHYFALFEGLFILQISEISIKKSLLRSEELHHLPGDYLIAGLTRMIKPRQNQ